MEERVYYLLQQYVEGIASEQETEELGAYLQEDTYREQLTDWLAASAAAALPEKKITDASLEAGIRSILAKTPAQQTPVRKIRRMAWVAVAAVLFALVAGIGLLQLHTQNNTPVAGRRPQVRDIAPGHNGAVLTLGDGSQVALDSVGNGRIAVQGNTTVTLANGRLAYKAGSTDSMAAIAWNTMTTPRGRQFQLLLPDGTKVWLNAASSIRYPTAFAGTTRQVMVTGEVYLEVAENARQPFIATAGNTDVTVLGTHFNIMAYPEEQQVHTTLLEGAVKVMQAGSQVILRPGQQAAGNSAGVLQVKTVDTEEVMAWVKGQLSMENMDVAALMRQISRWYDVDVVIEGPLPAKRFFGVIDRNVYLSNILGVLEENGVKARMEGKKIVVSAQ